MVNVAPAHSSSKILINNGNYAYLRLAGPNLSNLPVMMTADLSLDAGGSAGLAYIDISPDGSVWTYVKTQADFASGYAVYYLPGSEFMTDIYVRFRNASGTNGIYLRIGEWRYHPRFCQQGQGRINADYRRYKSRSNRRRKDHIGVCMRDLRFGCHNFQRPSKFRLCSPLLA